MGLIKAFSGAIGGQFADQWLDYIMPVEGMGGHVLAGKGVSKGTNAGRGSNTSGSENVITNGSKIFVPEGTAAIFMQDGGITGIAAEAGGYTWTSDNDPNSKTVFSGNGILASTLGASFERAKFGGQPSSQQFVFYVNLKDIMGLRYGTQNPIRYKDANYANAMLAVTSNGTYTIRVIDPILMFKNLLPVEFVSGQTPLFDLDADGSGIEEGLFAGFVGSLASALSAFTKGGKSIDDIQGGQTDFAKSMNEAIEANYQWGTKYGIEVVSVQPMGLDWDAQSVELINKFNTGFLMQGGVGAAYAQTQVAEGINAAGQNGAAGGVFGMGMAVNTMGGPAMYAQQGGMNPVVAQQQAQMQQAQQMPQMQPQQPMMQQMPAQPVAPQPIQQPAPQPEQPINPNAQ
ncbi:MAG: SPFH domain-containing protein [Candidatus Nomurabacteria bacterium]|jgi:membrane protease subunit (stomatin/prohibitin family)|nr:SPFH domain-containing protein [Candidatus Nomurabacteria bacterium]